MFAGQWQERGIAPKGQYINISSCWCLRHTCRLWEIENSVVGLHNSFTAGYIHTLMKQVKIKQQAFLPRPMSDLANSSSSMVPLQEILKRNSLEFGMQALHEVLRKWSQMWNHYSSVMAYSCEHAALIAPPQRCSQRARKLSDSMEQHRAACYGQSMQSDPLLAVAYMFCCCINLFSRPELSLWKWCSLIVMSMWVQTRNEMSNAAAKGASGNTTSLPCKPLIVGQTRM